MDISAQAEEFRDTCQAMLDRPEISPETAYRVRKILERFKPITGRSYLKTIKGAQTVSLCIAQARDLAEHLNAGDELLYRLLTDLEETHEGLLRTAYEFRIIAG